MTDRIIRAAVDSGRQLVVEFEQQADRWSHQVRCEQQGDSTIALASVEGSSDQIWPPAPAVQQFSSEARESGVVALLVGMAGKSFWSMSVHADGADLVFDVGCRHQIQPEWLGSRYEVRAAECCIRPDGDASLAAEATQVEVGQASITVIPLGYVDADAGMTRWRYRISLADPA